MQQTQKPSDVDMRIDAKKLQDVDLRELTYDAARREKRNSSSSSSGGRRPSGEGRFHLMPLVVRKPDRGSLRQMLVQKKGSDPNLEKDPRVQRILKEPPSLPEISLPDVPGIKMNTSPSGMPTLPDIQLPTINKQKPGDPRLKGQKSDPRVAATGSGTNPRTKADDPRSPKSADPRSAAAGSNKLSDPRSAKLDPRLARVHGQSPGSMSPPVSAGDIRWPVTSGSSAPAVMGTGLPNTAAMPGIGLLQTPPLNPAIFPLMGLALNAHSAINVGMQGGAGGLIGENPMTGVGPPGARLRQPGPAFHRPFLQGPPFQAPLFGHMKGPFQDGPRGPATRDPRSTRGPRPPQLRLPHQTGLKSDPGKDVAEEQNNKLKASCSPPVQADEAKANSKEAAQSKAAIDKKRANFEYSSPLGTIDSTPADDGYNSYNRPKRKPEQDVNTPIVERKLNNSAIEPQTPVKQDTDERKPDIDERNLDSQPKGNMVIDVPKPDKPLSDVFKSFDPTASPFC